MKKFASFVSLSIAAGSLAAGCAVEAVDSAELDQMGTGEEAACLNLDGTNAMMAAVASAVGAELGRWEITKDFELYRGFNNQEMLRIKASSRGLCKNNCRNTDALLFFQDSRQDQQFIFKGGQKLNSWTFASRLTAGFKNQFTCEARSTTDPNNCRGEVHFLERTGTSNATCDGVDQGLMMTWFKGTKGTTTGPEFSPETLLTLAQLQTLQKKLRWAEADPNQPGSNPYIQFQVVQDPVSLQYRVGIDPGDGTVEEPPPPPPPEGTPGAILEVCQKFDAVVNLANPAQACKCNGSVNTFMRVWSGRPAGWYKCML